MTEAILSVLVNIVLLVALPLGVYGTVQRIRHQRTWSDMRERTGLVLGNPVYIGYCAMAAVAVVIALLIWPPSVANATADGSAFGEFTGLGLTGNAVMLALLYGILKTGFAEEFLFRGMITGSLARRMSETWANVTQSVIFLAPHLFILAVAPDMWPILPVVFVGAMFTGWVRIRSGSIVGPWLLHATANVTMALSVAIRSAG